MTVSVDLLVGSTVFKSQHNRLELPYIKRMMVVILYGKKKIVWQERKVVKIYCKMFNSTYERIGRST